MTNATSAEIAKDWSTRLGQSTAKIKRGVQGVTVAPGQAAARQKDVWLANIQAAADKWATRVAAVPLSDWQTAMVNKGIARIATGATAAEGKFATFMDKFLPYVKQGVGSLPARGTFEQNLTRMNTMVQHLHQFSK